MILQGGELSPTLLAGIISALVALVGFLVRQAVIEMRATKKEAKDEAAETRDFFAELLKNGDKRFQAESEARTRDAGLFLDRLDATSKQISEAHEREVKFILGKLEGGKPNAGHQP